MDKTRIDSKITEHYQTYPYPNIPLIASIPKEQLWQINFDWLARKNGIASPSRAPSIWIAGCGTFQPYTLSQANPSAGILATDISDSSLKIAKQRCFLHQKRNVDFAKLDLNNIDAYPDESFDWIECYGVLMSVRDPLKTLKEFSKKIKPNGFIRIMVYPHYGRQRIFQIQEVARLLGLTLSNPKAPLQLKKLMEALPNAHPLKYAFFSYDDTKNKEGIADAFLHPNDRAFTGYEVCKLIEDAGLEISSTLHRPWGQPGDMAEKLGLLEHSPATWIHYLDLWQSMKSNFIFCLRKKGSEYSVMPSDRHALFDLTQKGAGLKHRIRLARMALTGSRLQTRTEEKFLELSGREVRSILSHSPHELEKEKRMLIPGFSEPRPLKNLLRNTSAMHPSQHFTPRESDNAINPIYDYLFDAYREDERLPSLKEQISRLSKHCSPLEDDIISFGLTPLGTYTSQQKKVESILSDYKNQKSCKWEDIKLQNEDSKFKELKQLLEKLAIPPPNDNISYRKLWVLLLSYPELTLPFKPS